MATSVATAGAMPADTTEEVTSIGTEIRAGFTTYLTMCYILFVNAGIMSSVADHNGLKLGFIQVMTVTALGAGVLCLLMGFYANAPFALATGLGLNAFVAFTLVGSVGLTWPEASGVIVMEGLVVFLATATPLRQAVITAIPEDQGQWDPRRNGPAVQHLAARDLRGRTARNGCSRGSEEEVGADRRHRRHDHHRDGREQGQRLQRLQGRFGQDPAQVDLTGLQPGRQLQLQLLEHAADRDCGRDRAVGVAERLLRHRGNGHRHQQ
jgi:hypothetical protein